MLLVSLVSLVLLALLAALVALIADVLHELELVLAPLLVPSDCACRAAIKLCMNCWNAALTVAASELEELLEEVPEVDPEEEVDALEDVVLEDESLPDVAAVPATPADCSASMTAAMSPPPGGGVAWPVEFVALLPLLESVDWDELKYKDGSH